LVFVPGVYRDEVVGVFVRFRAPQLQCGVVEVEAARVRRQQFGEEAGPPVLPEVGGWHFFTAAAVRLMLCCPPLIVACKLDKRPIPHSARLVAGQVTLVRLKAGV
jgi:hypothetical protein